MESKNKTEKPDQDQVTVGSTKLASANDKKRRLKVYGSIATALIFGVIGSYMLLSSHAAPPKLRYFTSLNSNNRTLSVNEAVVTNIPNSGNPAYRLIMQGDGNLVVYNAATKPIWQSGTHGTGSNNRLVMQGDGNLVVYTSANRPVWNSATSGAGSNLKLLMQGDGNVVLYTDSTDPLPIWSTYTGVIAHNYSTTTQLVTGQTLYTNQILGSSPTNPAYRLIMQGDGNLVVYNAATKPIWQSGTHGTGSNNRLVMQGDGNLVVYTSANRPVWNSATSGAGSNLKLLMQGDGNAVLYKLSSNDDKLTPLWSTYTGRLPAPVVGQSIAVKFNGYYCGGSIYPGYHFYQAQSSPPKPNDRTTSGCSGGTIGYILPTQTEGSVPLYYTRPTSLTRKNTFLTTNYDQAVHTIGTPQGQDNACFTQNSTCKPEVIGYVQTSTKPDTVPLYGVYSADSQTFYFTTSEAEYNTVLYNIQKPGIYHGWPLGIVAHVYTKAQVGGKPAW